jgi:hypothetical protein
MGWLVRGSQLQVAKTRNGRHDSVRSRTQEALVSVVIARKARRPTFVTPQKSRVKMRRPLPVLNGKKGNAAARLSTDVVSRPKGAFLGWTVGLGGSHDARTQDSYSRSDGRSGRCRALPPYLERLVRFDGGASLSDRWF